MAQASRQTTKHLTDLASRFCSSFVWIGELFADILRGGKSYSYKVSSTISPEEVCILHTAILNNTFLSSDIQNSFSGRKVSILADMKKNNPCGGSIHRGIDEETGFLLIDTKGGEMNV